MSGTCDPDSYGLYDGKLLSGSDTIPPTVTALTLGTRTILTVAIAAFTATDNIAVTGYCLNETASAPTEGACTGSGWSATAQTSYTFTSAGAKTLYVWAKDAAGNISTSLSGSVAAIPAIYAPWKQ